MPDGGRTGTPNPSSGTKLQFGAHLPGRVFLIFSEQQAQTVLSAKTSFHNNPAFLERNPRIFQRHPLIFSNPSLPSSLVRYHIIHRTTYTYESPVTVGHYTARLEPRALPFQECPWHEITIRPIPMQRAERADSFGNTCVYFEIEGSHQKLEVIARSLVEVARGESISPSSTPAWETVRDACRADRATASSLAGELAFASQLIPIGSVFADYARPSFPAHRPILEAVCDLNRRIHEDFIFDPAATDFATPVEQVLKKRRGVCQDFAQVMIACLRSLGLPTRYVSGYLETLPPPGQVKLVGADASHAWVSVYCGETAGWMDADPTNNILPSDRHITVAWGRDFGDVSPLRGVTIGAGEQRLQVAVDVLPEAD